MILDVFTQRNYHFYVVWCYNHVFVFGGEAEARRQNSKAMQFNESVEAEQREATPQSNRKGSIWLPKDEGWVGLR